MVHPRMPPPRSTTALRSRDGLAKVHAGAAAGTAFRPEGELSGVLSIRDRSGLETDVVLRATAGTVPPRPPTMGLRRLLGFAFLGGLILNLMPCDFPVLALKVVGLAGAGKAKARWQGVAYTAGVLVAFAGLGAALLAGRAAGTAAGWGFQFQSPVFVAAIAWLLFAVGVYLSGVYPPGWASGWYAPGTAWPRAPDNWAASSPGCLPWWWRRHAPRPSWASPLPPALPRHRR